ncbi:hypothetical protein BN6_10100 [Saccharothrix espanaensis DSM 44229]|uniref:Uncharacterized protein n=1 Tax=Saccharothrix espanaensis (strain ATCC 51144 / DSM 44229 / JCM 9112 / NBRC 15066 / NRRL 15764) TaxID=1179773 RepID=K0JVU6_SACES|nr:hypothetical protein BN6_10100 [Saccharothrix espanaensis DSM 44229]
MKTQNGFPMPSRLLATGFTVSGTAHVAGQKSARDRYASQWGAERVQLIKVPAAYEPTVVPTQNVAPSAHERGT